MDTYEKLAYLEGYGHIAGVDEAGRGPLAGPVVAAALVFDREFLVAEQSGVLRGINDSKTLSALQRERFFVLLTTSPHVAWAVGQADMLEIDQLNILRATHQAMARALAALPAPPPDFAIVDGLPVPGLPCPSLAIVKGDGRSLSIAAASIIAKVTRDRLMEQAEAEWPGYGFARHKGYGTAAHLEALRSLGPTPLHRRSFAPVREVLSGIRPPEQLDFRF